MQEGKGGGGEIANWDFARVVLFCKKQSVPFSRFFALGNALGRREASEIF